MSSPLDDAMHKWDLQQRSAAESARRSEAESEKTRAAYRELIRDFLARMNNLGNRGTETITYKVGTFKTVRLQIWRLLYDRPSSGSSRYLLLTTDGCIWDGYPPTPVSKFDFARMDSHFGMYSTSNSFETLSMSMAEVLRRYSH